MRDRQDQGNTGSEHVVAVLWAGVGRLLCGHAERAGERPRIVSGDSGLSGWVFVGWPWP